MILEPFLDSSGADQLIGRGDLLYTQGNDMVRIQCAFVDTPEVEKTNRLYWISKSLSECLFVTRIRE